MMWGWYSSTLVRLSAWHTFVYPEGHAIFGGDDTLTRNYQKHTQWRKNSSTKIQHCLGHFLFIEKRLKLNITLEINMRSKIRQNYFRNRCGRVWNDVNLVLLLLLSAKLRLFMGSYLLVEPYCTANPSNYPHKYGPH